MLENKQKCQDAISKCFGNIIAECRTVLGSELHYQAMIYHLLRQVGEVPLNQLGMNVKTTISNVSSPFLQDRILKKNKNYQSFGIEIIPDISFFRTELNGDWRRRNHVNTFKNTLYALEIKASERHNGRISYKEIETDILKLTAQAEETQSQHRQKIGTGLIIIDTAPKLEERITNNSLTKIIDCSKLHSVDLWYFSQDNQLEILH